MSSWRGKPQPEKEVITMGEPRTTGKADWIEWHERLKAELKEKAAKAKRAELDFPHRRKALDTEASEGAKKEVNMLHKTETQGQPLTDKEMERRLAQILAWAENRAKGSTPARFNPSKHLTRIQGRDYLEVKWRLVWFRQDHPDWSIETEPVEINTERRYVIYRALVKDETGRLIATGTKAESQNGFPDYLEKAETGAVGRALALCGYGTQFAPELEEGPRIVDSPIEKAA